MERILRKYWSPYVQYNWKYGLVHKKSFRCNKSEAFFVLEAGLEPAQPSLVKGF